MSSMKTRIHVVQPSSGSRLVPGVPSCSNATLVLSRSIGVWGCILFLRALIGIMSLISTLKANDVCLVGCIVGVELVASWPGFALLKLLPPGLGFAP